MKLGAVILTPEPPAPTNGEQLELLAPSHLLEAALKPFFHFPLDPIVLVLGHDYHRILNMLNDLPPQVKVVIHRKPERGLSSALSVGLAALNPEIAGIAIAKGDQIVESRVLERLLKAFEREMSGDPPKEEKKALKKRIIVPLYRGKRGFPWVVSSELRKPLSHLEGDFMLTSFLKENRKEILTVAADAP